ncbi:uncharacterized protein ATNIH1004_009561 [Aspergillus tanneri]|uniref:Uncharacterized protein n=1 Tax=Aspergillus tanneri TaxID=1220188 RepID=A0A5M9ME75_9EURO|nr:uncharacterized protein ATNIH1004_009561 [Aspergillus tanneri]KAA8642809.1 hypothetical protein ATNIH1004_009561 [Aspergillus tanneri]
MADDTMHFTRDLTGMKRVQMYTYTDNGGAQMTNSNGKVRLAPGPADQQLGFAVRLGLSAPQRELVLSLDILFAVLLPCSDLPSHNIQEMMRRGNARFLENVIYFAALRELKGFSQIA